MVCFRCGQPVGSDSSQPVGYGLSRSGKVVIGEEENLELVGPLRLVVEEGALKIFGVEVSEREILLEWGKKLVVGGYARCSLSLGSGGAARRVDSSADVESFRCLADAILDSSFSRVVVLGDMDTGKTTLCHALVNLIASTGRRVALVDGDVGQSSIGPPCVVSYGVVSAPVATLSSIRMEDGYFVGSNTPAGHLLQVCVGVKRMVEKAFLDGAEVVVVDTSGMVHGGAALALKRAKIELVDPEMVVAIQRGDELEGMLGVLEGLGYLVKRVGCSPRVEHVSRENRVFLRNKALIKHFSDASNVFIDLDKVWVVGSGYGSRLVRGVMVGLLGKGGKFLDIGRVDSIDFEKRLLGVYTHADPGKVVLVVLGTLLLGSDGREVGKPQGFR